MNMLASRGQLRASFLRWALFTVPLCVLLGFLSGQLGSPDTAWFQSLVKPGIYPEPKWFGIVWTILYVMIGFALALVASAWGARGRTAALWVFAVHFALNLAWSYVFFGAQQISGALARYKRCGEVMPFLRCFPVRSYLKPHRRPVRV